MVGALAIWLGLAFVFAAAVAAVLETARTRTQRVGAYAVGAFGAVAAFGFAWGAVVPADTPRLLPVIQQDPQPVPLNVVVDPAISHEESPGLVFGPTVSRDAAGRITTVETVVFPHAAEDVWCRLVVDAMTVEIHTTAGIPAICWWGRT